MKASVVNKTFHNYTIIFTMPATCMYVESIFQLQNKGRCPLRSASFGGHLDIVKTLIEAGANVNQASKVGNSIEPNDCYNSAHQLLHVR